ncbi:MAG: ABC transporter ATP-binding protein [Anaerolineae bacterium]
MKHLLRAGKFLAPYKWQALAAFLALLLSNGASLIQPQFTRLIVDRGIDAADMRLIVWLCLGLVGFSILNSLFNFTQGALMVRTAQDVAYDMRNRIYSKIQALSFSYHDQAQTGQLMTRATSDVDLVQGFLGQGFLMVVGSALMMIGSLIFLFITNWQLSIVMLVIVPLSFAIFGRLNTRIRPMFRIVQQRLSHLNTVLQESLVGVRVVKAFVREPHEAQRFEAANQELYDINVSIAKNVSFLFPLIFLFSNTATLAVYWIGGGQVIRGQLSLGEMISFINYMMMAFWPMMTVTMVITMISQASASAERIFEVLDARSEVVEKPDAVLLPPVAGRVVFDDVSFRYIEHGDPVLSQVSFEAEPGQVIALLGATGSGKSTIINLIPRFYDVTEGRVLIDGTDVRDVTIESLRSQIGIVFQETTLFAGTVKENIAFGRPEATMDEIVAAAKAAEAHDFIASFPDGYDTQVGERGMTLSGGQKQRVAIARALVLDPRILILDDSTSSVDLETEYRIQQALDRLMEGRTSFVIAQRIATVLNADQILVLERGEVVASGVHEELMASSEIYAEIYHSQLLQDTDLSGEDVAAGPVVAPAAVTGAQFSTMGRAEGMRPRDGGPSGGPPRTGVGASQVPPRREIE